MDQVIGASIFSTERLIVRCYTEADVDNFFAINGDPRVMQYIRTVKSREETEAFLRANIALYSSRPGMGRWAVDEKKTGKYIGSFAIIPVPEEEEKIQIGYALLPEYWGLGYATELTRKGIIHAFGVHPVDELYAITETPNVDSQKVLLKAGFRSFGTKMEGEKELLLFIINRNMT